MTIELPDTEARKRRLLRKAALTLVALLALMGFVLAGLLLLADSRRRIQMHTDPNVATAWVVGITYGPIHALTLGTPLQKWFNDRDIHTFGDYHSVQSGYNGDPGSVEIWFDYQSYLPHAPQLECHRVGQTAFVDDLGQAYHGYLDFQGKLVGVYLPGYDHAAHRLTCALRWMPRQPAPPDPVSNPMVFTIDLPPARRILPSAAALPQGLVTAANQGVTVTVSEARLSAPRTHQFSSTQRDLAFRIKIEGGELANANVLTNPYGGQIYSTSGSLSGAPVSTFLRRYRIRAVMPPLLGRSRGVPAQRRFTITDPYGVSLLSSDGLFPMASLESAEPLQNQNGTVWVAPVNGAGRSTDAIRLQFDVRPTGHTTASPSASGTLIPFDIVVPVQTSDEA